MRYLLSAIFILALALGGCVGTDVGNPGEGAAEVELDARGYDSQSNPGSLTLESGLRIDSAWLSMDGYQFKGGEGCENTTDAIEKPILVDVVSNTTVTETPSFDISVGDYCELDIAFVPWSGDVPDGAPAQMQGLSILVEGARSDGTEFVLRSDADNFIQLAAQNNVFALNEGREPLIVGFAIDEWFNEQTLDIIDAGGSSIEIDAEANTSVLAQFQGDLRRSGRLFRDDDANGMLSFAERMQALARGRAPDDPGPPDQ